MVGHDRPCPTTDGLRGGALVLLAGLGAVYLAAPAVQTRQTFGPPDGRRPSCPPLAGVGLEDGDGPASLERRPARLAYVQGNVAATDLPV